MLELDNHTKIRLERMRRTEIPNIFHQAQTHTQNHGKNCVALYKLHSEAQEIVTKPRKGDGYKAVGEKEFRDAFLETYCKYLQSQKVDSNCADRIARFVGGYVKHINEKDAENGGDIDDEDDDEDDEPRSPEARFTKALLSFLVDGLVAKEKLVRYRIMQTLTEMIKHLGTLSNATYSSLREVLLDRLECDREHSIRSKAAISLGYLCVAEGIPKDTKEESVHRLMLTQMATDVNVDVRKTIVLNVRVDKESIPAILDRLRDKEAPVRKAVIDVFKSQIYLGNKEERDIGPCHPTQLKLLFCLKILKYGLQSRDPSISEPTAALMLEWLKAYEEEEVKREETDKPKRANGALVALVRSFQVQKRKKEVLQYIATMVKDIFKRHPQAFNEYEFGENHFWGRDACPEDAFILRAYTEFCHQMEQSRRMENILPSVSAMAAIIKARYHRLLVIYDEEDIQRPENAAIAEESILSDLLRVARDLDYGDHSGAQTMRIVVREMIVVNRLPDPLLDPCLDVLRSLSGGERDLIRSVVEIVQELRDTGEEEEDEPSEPQNPDSTPQPTNPKVDLFLRPRNEMDPEIRQELNYIDLRCLILCRGMLERIGVTSPTMPPELNALVKDLIMPSANNAEGYLVESDVQRSQDSTYELLFERSAACYCLLGLMVEAFAPTVFIWLTRRSDQPFVPENVKLVMFQGIFDLAWAYGTKVLPPDCPIMFEDVTKALVEELEHQANNPPLLAVVCQGIAKLVLRGIVSDLGHICNLFRQLVLPSTAGNEALRQYLRLFFDKYSSFSKENKIVMANIFIPIYRDQAKWRKKAEEDDELEVVSASDLCRMFEVYTDPKNISEWDSQPDDYNSQIHLIQLIMQEGLLEPPEVEIFEKDDLKQLFQFLGRVSTRLPDSKTVDALKVCGVKSLSDKIRECRPPRDAPSDRAFTKFETIFARKYENELEIMSDEDYYELEQLRDIFNHMDSVVPETHASGGEISGPVGRTRKRRSTSTATTNSDMEDIKPIIDEQPAKRRRLESEGSDIEASRAQSTTSTLPPQDRPSRASRPRPSAPPDPSEVIVISSDEDEEPPPPPRPRAATASSIRDMTIEIKQEETSDDDDDDEEDEEDEEEQGRGWEGEGETYQTEEGEETLDRDLSRLLSLNNTTEQTWDSIMDSEQESDEELEVLNHVLDDWD